MWVMISKTEGGLPLAFTIALTKERHPASNHRAAPVSSLNFVISSPPTRLIHVQYLSREVEEDTRMYQEPTTTTTLGTSALKAAVSRCYKELDGRASQGKLRTGTETSVFKRADRHISPR